MKKPQVSWLERVLRFEKQFVKLVKLQFWHVHASDIWYPQVDKDYDNINDYQAWFYRNRTLL